MFHLRLMYRSPMVARGADAVLDKRVGLEESLSNISANLTY